MPESMTPLVAVGVIGALFVLLLSLLTNNYSLNNIKSKTVGDGQYGTARWATEQEIRKTYVTVPFDVAAWRAGKKRPTVQVFLTVTKTVSPESVRLEYVNFV